MPQVKNFGRSGRTKYTHLVDQDTTEFDAPWADNSALNIKFHSQISAGMKQSFERPTVKKRKWWHLTVNCDDCIYPAGAQASFVAGETFMSLFQPSLILLRIL